jgi:hypothetical protein
MRWTLVEVALLAMGGGGILVSATFVAGRMFTLAHQH